jgi:lysophospholipase L1-like esterase
VFPTACWLVILGLVAPQLRAQAQAPAQPQAPAQAGERADNVRGEIKSIEPAKITLEDGTSVALNAQTRYRKVNDENALFEDVKFEDAKAGMFAAVAPNKLPDGSLVARMVFVASSKDRLNAGWAKLREIRAATQQSAAAPVPGVGPALVAQNVEAPVPAAAEVASAAAPAAGATATQPLSREDPTVGAPKRAGATTQSVTSAQQFMDLHQQFLARAKQGNIDLLFLGDSITHNWSSARGKAIWDERYAPLHAANFGIGGDRTQHVIWRIENGELDGIKPKVTVLMIGTNNSGDNSPEQIAAAIEKIVGLIRAKIPTTKVLLLAVFPRTRPNEEVRVETIKRVNQIIAKLDDGKSIRYLDIGGKFLGPDGTVPKDIMPDGLHPNEKGYQIWADAMAPLLDEMMKN